MAVREMPRVQEVILPYLREHLPEVQIVSWVPAVEDRQYPILNVRRLGGLPVHPKLLDRPVIELTCYGDQSLPDTEAILYTARELLWTMCNKQVVMPKGYVHSYFETMGPTQFDSPYEGTWRAQMLIQLGIRPPRS